MAIARTFPSASDYVETLIYPNSDNIRNTIVKRSQRLSKLLLGLPWDVKDIMLSVLRCEDVSGGVQLILGVPLAMVYLIYLLITLLLLMAYYPFSMLYHLLWKVASSVVPLIRYMECKKKEYDQAKEILHLVCEKIEREHPPESYGSFYGRPLLKAACQNASEVVYKILETWPESIRCTDENGYDIIQLAIIYRSEKVYNMIYDPWFPKSMYRKKSDSLGNNMLHLAGRLAPSYKLNLITGSALQLQRELQWRQEVKKLVYPSYATAMNIFNDTPDMVFTKEHENLVKEGEKWIRTVAESCSITAALITTIVFAAAITIPGGIKQETGIPVFKKEIAFTIFVVSDAISLCSSVTALLVFLSIVSARFAEEDFLFRLPNKMLVGLCTLFLSTTAMMVAFGATFFLVFTDHQLWMLAPISGSCFLPIAIYIILQVPLIIDLFRSTYTSKFGKSIQNNSQFNPLVYPKQQSNGTRFFFGKRKE